MVQGHFCLARTQTRHSSVRLPAIARLEPLKSGPPYMPASHIPRCLVLLAALSIAQLCISPAGAISVGELDALTIDLEGWLQGREPFSITRVASGGPGG